MNPIQALQYKVILIGDSKVGKSSFFVRFIKNAAPRSTQPTIGVEYASKEILNGSDLVTIKLWDTAGSEKYQALTSFHFRHAAAALLFYDLTERDSYDHVTSWLKQLQNLADDKIVVILVGNKLDLVHDSDHLRCVPQEEVKQLCRRKNLHYVEVSAKTGEGVDGLVKILLNNLKDQPQIQNNQAPQRQKCCST